MIPRLGNHLLISPGDLPPSRDGVRVIGAFNPGGIEHDGGVTLLVRVVEAVDDGGGETVKLPRWVDGRIATDEFDRGSLEPIDPRVVRTRAGTVRLTFTSHLRVVHSADGLSVDRAALANAPAILPATDYETFGLEDARITQLDGRYWITCVAVSERGVATALMSTTDFQSFDRHGIIFPPENKDVTLFPRKVSGRYVAMHRPSPAQPFCPPRMWLASSDNLLDWGGHAPLDAGDERWQSGRVGGGCPPIETERGWLVIYHGATRDRGGRVGTYHAAAMLLDLDDPSRVIARSAEPIMTPQTDYERDGFVPNVVFPTAAVRRGDRLRVYYGAADTHTAVVEWSLADVLGALA